MAVGGPLLRLAVPRTALIAAISARRAATTAPAAASPKRCMRIVGFDKEMGHYVRCNTLFTDKSNSDTACQYHAIGLWEKIGGGNWYNCCKSNDFSDPGCMIGPHSSEVDDSDLRGKSIDPRSPDDVRRLRASSEARKQMLADGKEQKKL
eukprot:m.127662 g.127662  ORF g.127662 m.127662 type:complete len:150 (-) comp16369_c1_seq1:508-957(-)